MALVHLVIPEGTEPPPIYKKATPEEVLEMLTLGALVHELVLTQRSEDDAKARAADYAKELQRLQVAKETEIAALKVRYEKDTAAMRLVLEEKAAADKELTRLQQESTLRQVRAAEGRIAELQERKAAADADVQAQLQRIRESEHAASERILAAKEAELCRVLAEKEGAEADRRAMAALLQEKLTTLTEEIRRKPATSKEKGALFEAAIDDLVRASWGAVEGFSIADHSARGHRGDRIVTVGDQTVLLECKDYGDVVPKSEVEKFYKDVSTNHAIQIGIMISRTTAIQGFSTRTAIDFVIQEGKLHVFVNAFDRLETTTTLSVLLGWIRYWKQIQKPATDGEDKATAIRTVAELVERATVAKRELAVHTTHLDDFKAWSKKQADDTYKQLQQALLTLQRGTRTEEPVRNTVSSTSGSLFQRTVPEDADWIERIKSVTQEGGEARLSDIAKAVAAGLPNVSVPVVRLRIESVIHESALKKIVGFPTVVLGLRIVRV